MQTSLEALVLAQQYQLNEWRPIVENVMRYIPQCSWSDNTLTITWNGQLKLKAWISREKEDCIMVQFPDMHYDQYHKSRDWRIIDDPKDVVFIAESVTTGQSLTFHIINRYSSFTGRSTLMFYESQSNLIWREIAYCDPFGDQSPVNQILFHAAKEFQNYCQTNVS